METKLTDEALAWKISAAFETNSRLSFELRPRIIGAVNDAGGEPRVILRGKKAQELWRAPEASPKLGSHRSELK